MIEPLHINNRYCNEPLHLNNNGYCNETENEYLSCVVTLYAVLCNVCVNSTSSLSQLDEVSGHTGEARVLKNFRSPQKTMGILQELWPLGVKGSVQATASDKLNPHPYEHRKQILLAPWVIL